MIPKLVTHPLDIDITQAQLTTKDAEWVALLEFLELLWILEVVLIYIIIDFFNI